MRIIDIAGAACVLAALIGVAAWLTPLEQLGGRVVVDGDSLRIGSRDIRILGIDAPELHQTCTRDSRAFACGQAAKEELGRLTAGADVQCRITGRDRYGRSLARCMAGTRDLGAALVAQGMAVAYGAYDDEERLAREARRGLWAGLFERPSEWRKLHPRPSSAGAEHRSGAAGNVDARLQTR